MNIAIDVGNMGQPIGQPLKKNMRRCLIIATTCSKYIFTLTSLEIELLGFTFYF